jgi:hypothetical protein
LKSATAVNPSVVRIDQQIASLKIVQTSLRRMQTRTFKRRFKQGEIKWQNRKDSGAGTSV